MTKKQYDWTAEIDQFIRSSRLNGMEYPEMQARILQDFQMDLPLKILQRRFWWANYAATRHLRPIEKRVTKVENTGLKCRMSLMNAGPCKKLCHLCQDYVIPAA
ncbi:MAG: hypothetical protein ABL951_02585 [Alphaproteobacteria bacterium]